MSILLTVTSSLLGVLLVRHLVRRFKSNGPIGLPLLGSLPYMLYKVFTDRNFRWYQFVSQLRQRYGDVMSFVLGTQEIIVISGYKKIKSALIDRADMFSHRPNHPYYQFLAKGLGILYSEGQLWQDQRRFALRVLRDFGLGRSVSEQQIQVEAQELMRHLSERNGKETDVKTHVTKAVVNVIAGLVFAQRSGYEDAKLDEFLLHAKNLTQAGMDSMFMIFWPGLSIALSRLSPTSDRLLKSEQWIMEYCQEKIRVIEQNYDPSSEPNCFVEAFLREQRSRPDDTAAGGSFSDEQLLRTVFDLYLAGSDTTATTLRWALLYCSFYPEMQEACHKEIIANIGTREVSMKDKRALNKVQAFLDETQRLCNLVPTSVEHRAPQETELDGVPISPNCLIQPNLYSVHMDPELFPDPHAFNPERFIDQETGSYKPSEYLIPFSIGRRSCLGETLAKMEMFIFFVTLLQHLRFEPSEECKRKRDDVLLGFDGIVHSPGDHTLVVHTRKE